MVLTTDEYWDVDGVPLNTLAYNIQSWGGTRVAPAPVRGGNVLIPYRPGEVWVPKRAGSRVLTLGMWVIGTSEDGVDPADSRALYHDNWEKLLRLLYRPWTQYSLTKRQRNTSGLLVATALAEYAGGFEPGMIGQDGSQFVVDLLLADPYFYAPEQSAVVNGPTVVSHPGADVALGLEIDLPAGATLTNSDTGVSVTNTGAAQVTLDVLGFSSTGPILDITHTGSRFWMGLVPGDNNMTGSGTIRWQPNYF